MLELRDPQFEILDRRLGHESNLAEETGHRGRRPVGEPRRPAHRWCVLVSNRIVGTTLRSALHEIVHDRLRLVACQSECADACEEEVLREVGARLVCFRSRLADLRLSDWLGYLSVLAVVSVLAHGASSFVACAAPPGVPPGRRDVPARCPLHPCRPRRRQTRVPPTRSRFQPGRRP